MAIDVTKVKRYTTYYAIPIYDYSKTLWHECIEAAMDIVDMSIKAVQTYAEGLLAAVTAQVGVAQGHAEDAGAFSGEAEGFRNEAEVFKDAAAASAAAAAALAGAFSGTSTTSLTVGTGLKTFVTQEGESYSPGIFVTAVSEANPGHFMFGQVDSYTVDELVLDVIALGGAGETDADWNLSLSGVPGPPGPGITEQTVGFTLEGGTTSKTFTGDADLTASEVATKAGTQTLTNKRITKRVSTTASSGTPTPNADTDDLYVLTAQAASATFGAPTGTPTDGQPLTIRIKDDGTARALAYNAIYRASTDLALPSTTVLSKTLYLGFIYNAADSKWDLVAVLNKL